MAFADWQEKRTAFKTIDVRGLHGNFFPRLKKEAEALPVGSGLTIVQSFDPIPLYDVMQQLGYEFHTEKKEEHAFYVYFYRTEIKEADMNSPMRPTALTNFPIIDEDLGSIAVSFWDLTWNNKKRFLPYETRLLLSLANAVGAGRMRQATRELIKAYAQGTETAALDDVFELLAWNQGIGFFSSEIGPSTLFKAYAYIKQQEQKGKNRAEITVQLMEQFGEKHPDVRVS